MRVKEIFSTLQGEGELMGLSAVFVRFAGCSLWSGREADRSRDSARNGAACPLFCDTDFVGGLTFTEESLADEIARVRPRPRVIVLTGGEPSLQVTPRLLEVLRPLSDCLSIETNGLRALPEGLDWICVSPKTLPDRLVVTAGDELKVVYPAMDPLNFEHLIPHFKVATIVPEASPGPRSLISRENTQAAIRLVQGRPWWRLGLQAHKIWGIR